MRISKRSYPISPWNMHLPLLHKNCLLQSLKPFKILSLLTMSRNQQQQIIIILQQQAHSKLLLNLPWVYQQITLNFLKPIEEVAINLHSHLECIWHRILCIRILLFHYFLREPTPSMIITKIVNTSRGTSRDSSWIYRFRSNITKIISTIFQNNTLVQIFSLNPFALIIPLFFFLVKNHNSNNNNKTLFSC